MADRYEVLNYSGDVTAWDGAQAGQILGSDEFGRPYEVLDAEYDAATGRTAVHLQYATEDNLRAHLLADPNNLMRLATAALA